MPTAKGSTGCDRMGDYGIESLSVEHAKPGSSRVADYGDDATDRQRQLCPGLLCQQAGSVGRRSTSRPCGLCAIASSRLQANGPT